MFILELCMLAALAYWGSHNSATVLTKCLFGIGAPLLAATFWAIFAAPKSTRRLALPYRMVFSLAVFLSAGILLYQTGLTSYAITFMVVAVICQLLVLMLEE